MIKYTVFITTQELPLNNMKKTAFITALLTTGLVATAGEPVVIAEPTIAPACACPLSWEFGVAENTAANDIITAQSFNRVKLSTITYDLTGLYSLDQHNAIDLRFGFGHGKDSSARDEYKDSYTGYSFYLMPGYRYTTPICDNMTFFAGANAGLINHSLKFKRTSNAGSVSAHDSDYGLAMSAEVGVTYDICKNVYLFWAYQYSTSTAQPKPDFGGGFSVTAHKQQFHSFRAGVGVKF